MTKIGVLRVNNGVSQLEGWRVLARDGADPRGAATDFIAELGFGEPDRIKVTGNLGSLPDGTSVCFITNAEPAPVQIASTRKRRPSAPKK